MYGNTYEFYMQCKKCEGILIKTKQSDLSIYKCNGCHGILIEKESFLNIINIAEEIEKKILFETVDQTPKSYCEDETFDFLTVMNCPSCESPMENHPYLYTSGIKIDSCISCNYIWLDHGKLHKLNKFMLKIDDYDHEIKSLLPKMMDINREVSNTFKEIDKESNKFFNNKK